jgi:uncharacterized membrane protein
MEYTVLVFVHVLGAILWGGMGLMAYFFLIPSVQEAGPAGGAVMAGLMKRKMSLVMNIAAYATVISGLRLYQLRFSMDWLTTAQGLGLTLGGLLGLGALAIGQMAMRPTAEKLGDLGAQIKAAGTPPSPEQAAQMAALGAKMGKLAKVMGFHMLGAVVLMTLNRLLAQL